MMYFHINCVNIVSTTYLIRKRICCFLYYRFILKQISNLLKTLDTTWSINDTVAQEGISVLPDSDQLFSISRTSIFSLFILLIVSCVASLSENLRRSHVAKFLITNPIILSEFEHSRWLLAPVGVSPFGKQDRLVFGFVDIKPPTG